MTAYPKPHGYRHGEAFALMWYVCEDCGHRERIWNSRDGVTPFGCSCPSCGRGMKHTDWRSDVCEPDYKLNKGQRFWRDGTPDEAETIMRRRIVSMRDQYPCSPEKEAELIRLARTGEANEFQSGWPMLEVFGAPPKAAAAQPLREAELVRALTEIAEGKYCPGEWMVDLAREAINTPAKDERREEAK